MKASPLRLLAALSASVLILCAVATPAGAAPILSPSTPVYGGVANSTLFTTGAPTTGFSGNAWPAAQAPAKAIDGLRGPGSKYLNFAATNTALLFAGSSARTASRLELWVAEDAVERDPASYVLYGTNAAVPALTSGGTFALSNFTQISSGTLALPATRDTTSDGWGFSQSVLLPGTTAYTSYLLVFPSVKGPSANSMQISEVQLYDRFGLIGTESFDYLDGPVAGKDGGQLWTYQNLNPLIYTGAPSTWDNVLLAPTVAGGKLVTNESAAKREYKGGSETDGAVNDTGSPSVAKVVYYKVTMTTGPTLPAVAGLSSYDFGDERLFFGKRFNSPTFGLDITGGGGVDSTLPVAANTTYTLVAKLDFPADRISLFVNPDLSGSEPIPLVSITYTGTNWSTAVRLASAGGGSPVTWDDLVVATAWGDLAPLVVTTTADEDNGLPGGGTGVSLREAVKYAPAGSTITFAPALSGQIITLTHPDGEMLIPLAVTIDATGLPGGLTMSGNNATRHFNVQSGKSLVLRGLTLTGGSSSAGGSIDSNGTLTLDRCTLRGNVSTIDGGAVYSTDTLRATDCTFAANTAGHFGGGLMLFAGTGELARCTFSGNAAASAGAFWKQGSTTATLSHCTVAGNRSTEAVSAGGIVAMDGLLSLQHCTISQNQGKGAGGGLFLQAPANVTVNNSIIAGNTDTGSSPDVYYSSGTLTATGTNLIGNNTGAATQFPATPGLIGTAAAPVDAKLSPLGSFGGPTMTMHPLVGSPAIDAAGTTDPGGTDARGFPRFVNGDNASPGSQLDIGAVEAGRLLVVTTAGDASGTAGANNFRSLMASAPSFGKATRLTLSTAISPTISLTQGELTPPADNTLFIDASNLPAGITFDAGGNSRVFNIPASATMAMHSVKIINGKAPNGLDVNSGTAENGASGGGVLNAGTLSLFDCTIRGNSSGNGGYSVNVAGNGGNGGGISSSGVLTVSTSTVNDNFTGRGGGAFSATTSGNGGDGGGIFSSGKLELHQSTFGGNATGHGPEGSIEGGTGGKGGAVASSGPTSVISCTLSRNRTGTGGSGAISNGTAGSGGGLSANLVTLQNCIIAGNTVGGTTTPGDVQCVHADRLGANLLSTAASLVTATGPAPLINADPKLAPLSDYGGPTFTMLPLPGSPALNAATGSTFLADQRGLPMNGTPDLGAVEVQAALSGFRDTDSDGMDDRLEPLYGFTVGVNDGNLDADGDGSKNKDELGNMTGPRDPASLLNILTFSRNGNNVTFTHTSFPGLSYTLEYGSTLNFGGTVGLGTATGMTNGNTVGPITGPNAFVRIRRN